eukprot:72621-Pelagomonas_calceolata.AAC.1
MLAASSAPATPSRPQNPPGERCEGRLGMFSSSNGKEPHSSAYRMTPQLQTSTSGPEYSLPEMTCTHRCVKTAVA